MSPRRTTTSGEDSILAMLEREPARKRGARSSNVRRLWYGAGATMVLALTGTLVWMAANNDGLRPEVEQTVLAEAQQAPRPATAAPGDHPGGAATVLQVAMAPAAAAPEAQAASAAVIVDQAPPPAAVPPLRLLKPAAEKPPASLPLSAAPPPRPAAKTSPPHRPAAAPAKPRPAMVAKSAVKPAQPRAQRGVNPARTAEAPVDADVALISAVIVHANGHAAEGSQMTELLCPNESCQPRPPRQ